MPPGIKALLVGFGIIFATAGLAVVATFVFVFSAGPSIAGGERAAALAGVTDVLLLLASLLAFWLLNLKLGIGWRIGATLLVAAIELAGLVGLFFATLVVLNR